MTSSAFSPCYRGPDAREPMYTTCLFCNSDLGRNESIESLPIGRRIAFDGERGRLWVVCRRCERWNLTAVEERWEALEECERAFGNTRLRVSTDHIGLARVGDGLELVRVGRALRPEFAAWRYGDQFGRRRRVQLAMTGGALALVGGVVVGGLTAGIGMAAFGGVIAQALQRVVNGNPGAVVARLQLPGGVLAIKREDLARTTLLPGEQGAFALSIDRKTRGVTLIEGPDAARAARLLFPAANRFGAAVSDVRAAVARIEHAGDPSTYLANAARMAATTHRLASRTSMSSGLSGNQGLFALPKVERLAIEMALQEEFERRAMEGELAELERSWRDAEEIAAIADDLLTPPSITRALEALKRRSP